MERDRKFALVCDYNPGLPNISRILGKHKHILEIDEERNEVIKPENIIASYRGAKTIQDMLVHSKLPTIRESGTNVAPEVIEGNVTGACQKCTKGCVLCKNYLKTCTTFSSYHTNSEFTLNENVDCNTTGVVYLINDVICKRSSVGCTTNSAKNRFGIHKSHIKNSHKSCNVAKHYSII